MRRALQQSARRMSTLPGPIEAVNEAALSLEYAQASGSLSPASVYGSSHLGQIALPHEVQTMVQRYVQHADKSELRRNALDLYEHLRSSSAGPKTMAARRASQRDPRPKRTLPPYNDKTVLAYAAGLMPSVYAATLHVLKETRKKLLSAQDSWLPDRILDFGSGTSSAAWAAMEVWPSLSQYVGVEPSGSMRALAIRLIHPLPASLIRNVVDGQFPLETSHSLVKAGPSNTLALAAFTLSEVGHPRERDRLIHTMWASGADALVFIERGTPAGFAHIAAVRNDLLKRGRQKQADQCHVLAPCPHDLACPLRFSGDFCHFSQRVQRPSFLMKTKHSKVGQEDTKFSYVVLRRGARPTSSVSADDLDDLKLGPLSPSGKPPAYLEPIERHDTGTASDPTPTLFEVPNGAADEGRVLVQPTGDQHKSLEMDALSWARLVAPPMKRSGHVILDACTKEGQIERFTIPKSQGKQPYHDARKAKWGDSFPHGSKHKSQVRHRGVRNLKPARHDDVELDEFVRAFGKGPDAFREANFPAEDFDMAAGDVQVIRSDD